jgi:hypothetical protein
MDNIPAKIKAFLLSLMILLLCIPTNASAQSDSPAYNVIAEQWIYSQVTQGHHAYLASRFPNPEDRVIRASFLQKLLSKKDSPAINHYGLGISDARVTGSLDMQHLDIPIEVIFDHMIFDDFFSFCRAHFYRDVWITDSAFNSQVNFCAAKIDGAFSLSQSTFQSSVELSGAKIAGDLVLEKTKFENKYAELKLGGTEIEETLFLQDATFNGPVNLSGARIGRALTINKSAFNNSANLDGANIAESLFLQEATFKGAASFKNIHTVGYFLADKAQFLNPDEEISFANMVIEKDIYFPEATFAGAASFAQVKSNGLFYAPKISFINSDKDVSFDVLTIQGALYLDEATFAGPVHFLFANIGSFMTASDAHFNHSTAQVDFGQMRVGAHASFDRTIFKSPVDFRFANIGNNLNLDKTKFEGPSAVFSEIIVGKNLRINQAQFSGAVNFKGAHTGGLYAENAKFTSPTGLVDFSFMQVDRDIYFKNASFSGPVSFTQTTSQDGFSAIGAQFSSADENVDFSNMVIHDNLSLSQATFNGPVEIENSVIDGNLSLDNATFNATSQAISFSGTKIGQNLLASRSIFAGPTHMDFMQINAGVYLSEAKFSKGITFYETRAPIVQIVNITWPVEPGQVNLRGLEYDNLVLPEQGFKKYLELLKNSSYDADSYRSFEKSLQKNGYPQLADRVYIAMKERERAKALDIADVLTLRWWSNVFLEGFVLYGRAPHFPVLWMLLLILIGVLVFRKQDKMLPKTENPRPYHPFLYSLDLFLPVANYGMARDWEPQPQRKLARFYAFLLHLSPWILIPIAILAILRLFD